jgi:hypothetical protein
MIPALAQHEVERLRAALVAAGGESGLTRQRELLLLAGFAVPEESEYDALSEPLAASQRYPQTW